MPSFIIVGCVWQILGTGGLFGTPHPHQWGAPKKSILNRVKVHQLMTRVTILGISIQSFLLWLFSRTDQVPLFTTVKKFYFFAFVSLFVSFSIWIFLNKHSWFIGQQQKRKCIYLTSLYNFHFLHRHFYISQVIVCLLRLFNCFHKLSSVGNILSQVDKDAYIYRYTHA